MTEADVTRAGETILIIEDDASLAQGLAHNLRYEGYKVLVATDGATGLRMACDGGPDLVVLDLMLPGINGLEILRALRTEGLEMQIIILSARGREQDKVAGLKLGADDYVAKPFGLSELLARIDAAMRRPREVRKRRIAQPILFADVVVDLSTREARRGDEPVHLTARELDLVALLASHPRRPFTREQLLRQVWGYAYDGTERTVDNFMRSLRRKLEKDPARPKHFTTVHGVGYRFVP